jgi:hypothetical protein
MFSILLSRGKLKCKDCYRLTLVPVTELRKEVASPPKACIVFLAVPEAEVLEDAPLVGFGNWREAADGG